MPNWKKVITSGSDAALNSLNVTTSLTASGLIYPAADNGEESFIQTDGNGNLSLQYVKTIYEEVVNGEATSIVKGTPVYVSGSVGAAAQVFRADAGNASKMPVIYVVADTIAPAANGRGIALGLIKGVDTTGYPAGTEIYVAVGGGWTSTRPTGTAIVQTLGYVTKEGAGGMGVILNPGPNSLPNLPAGNVWVGNSNALPVATATSSIQNVVSASFATTAGSTAAVAGTTNYVSKFTSGTTIGNSQIFDNGTNVGIGTASPGAKLDVYNSTGTVISRVLASSGNTARFDLHSVGGSRYSLSALANGNLLQFDEINGHTIATYVNGINGSWRWFTAGTERMRIDSTGNVGISTTSPSSSLHLGGTSGTLSSGLTFGDGDTGLYEVIDDTIGMSFGGLRRLRFSLTGVLSEFVGGMFLNYGSAGSSTNPVYTFNSDDNTGIGWGGSDTISLITAGSERMRITSTGNVGIGTTSPTKTLYVAGTTQISGSFNTAISGSILTVQGSGSAQPIFTVQGSQGELFSVTDSLSGSLFSVNDISGLPILEVFSDNTILMGDYLAPSLNTTVKTTTAVGNNIIYSIPTASYDGAFFEYTATSASNARAGSIMAIHNGGNIRFTETTTTDIGTTSGIAFTVIQTGGNIALTGSSATAGWIVKTIVRSI
jgi:hypothetical protein